MQIALLLVLIAGIAHLNSVGTGWRAFRLYYDTVSKMALDQRRDRTPVALLAAGLMMAGASLSAIPLERRVPECRPVTDRQTQEGG